jgi:hypothetical protein
MQARDLFPQAQKLPMVEQLALLNFLVQLIQQEVTDAEETQQLPENNLVASAQTVTAAPTNRDMEDAEQTVLERMGGMPQHLLSMGGLSDRDIRRQVIAERIRARYDHP